ncbi:alpha-mannosidase [Sporolactobacillus shoreae]|uniref:Alpha-mannosidase n=1 Tax=Sporolactobacillus shoreae TaxID=1465501 RepID=A0A4Z0GSJ8_9BACL|nr:glycoside hydrolase family 38 C-terminal domain-containing protein [Sporolactobacillus shoreae]TGA99886.1 alpha-mannosidase [Sporolactobacillus shoreae]
MVTSYIVNHTHWDREWYFTSMDALVLSDQLFTEVLDELEKNPDANFCLDGQSSIVDEYVEIHPEGLSRIRNLVNEGRLFLGPWYTQTDAINADAESILRNLIIGINDTRRKYGNPMMIGYLPDTFGFNAQIPELLNQAGIDNFLFWRGINLDKQVQSLYFKWKGLGDSRVYAINFPFGYLTGMITLDSKEHLQDFVNDRLDKAIEFESRYGNQEDVLIPSGIDQMNIVKKLGETVKKINDLSKYENKISSYLEFVNIIRHKKDLETYQGELKDPVYSRVHRTITSVRTKIKLNNFLIEQKILRRIEPLMVIAHNNGVRIGPGLLTKLWKKLLECQAHDSLGGSVSDNVAIDIMHRFKEADELADGIENMICKKMADAMELKDHDVLVFNTDPFEFEGNKTVKILTATKSIHFINADHPVILSEKYYPSRSNILKLVPKGTEYFDEPAYYELDVRIHVTLPPMGFKIIHFENSVEQLPSRVSSKEALGQNVSVQNDYFSLSFNDGEISLKSGDKVYDHIIEIVDSANDGDTYDYSPLRRDSERALTLEKAYTIKDAEKQSLVVIGATALPLDLEDRKVLSPAYGRVSLKIIMTVTPESHLIDGKLIVNNQVYSHRLRLKINTSIESDHVVAQIQNGFIVRENEPIPEDWEKKYVEKPVNIAAFDKSVTVEDSKSHFSVFAKGLKEYEYLNSFLFITLMSTTGQLGKPDLVWRPGRASGDTTNQGHVMMPTPLAQEIGESKFEFALNMEPSVFDEQKVALCVRDWLSPSVSYQLQSLNFFINRLDNKIWKTETDVIPSNGYSLIKADHDLIVSSIYPSYLDADAYIVRLSNPTAIPVPIPYDLLKDSIRVNALEEGVPVQQSVPAYSMVSLKRKFQVEN